MADKTILLATKIVGDGSDADKAFNSTGDSASKMGSKMQRAGNVAGKVLAVGLVAAGAAAVAATKAAAEDEAAAAKLEQTLRKAAGATDAQVASMEDWIGAQGKALGVADDELRPAISKLVAATGDLGKSQKLASLAMDISAATGKDLQTVTTALAKAQTGSTSGLSRLGVATETASGKTKSLAAITKDLSSTYSGAAAKAAETQAGKQKILAVQMGELQEEIGAKLLPVMGKLVDIGFKIIDWIDHNQTTAAVLATTLGVLTAAVWLTSKAIAAWSTITKVASGVQAAFNLVMAANPIILVTAAVVALGIALVVAYKKSETFRKIVDAVFGFIKKSAGAVIDFFRKHWKTALLVLLTGPIGLAYIGIKKKGGAIKDFLVGLPGKVTGFFKDHWKTALLLLLVGPFALKPVRDKASAIGRWLLDWVGKVVGWFRDLPGKVAGALTSLPGKLGAAARDGIRWFMDQLRGSPIVGWFRDLPGNIKDAIGDLSDLLFDIGADIINGLWEGMKDKWEDAKDWVGGVKDDIVDLKGPPAADKVLLLKSGQYIIDGLVKGMDSRRGELRDRLRKLTAEIRGGIGAATAEPIKLSAPRFAGSRSQLSGGPSRVAYITVNGAVDPMSTARQIRDLLNRQASWRGQLVTT